jgi:hypothetical protein
VYGIKKLKSCQGPRKGCRAIIIIIIIIIQFNSILYYLCAVPTAARPITDTAQCKKKVIT